MSFSDFARSVCQDAEAVLAALIVLVVMLLITSYLAYSYYQQVIKCKKSGFHGPSGPHWGNNPYWQYGAANAGMGGSMDAPLTQYQQAVVQGHSYSDDVLRQMEAPTVAAEASSIEHLNGSRYDTKASDSQLYADAQFGSPSAI